MKQMFLLPVLVKIEMKVNNSILLLKTSDPGSLANISDPIKHMQILRDRLKYAMLLVK